MRAQRIIEHILEKLAAWLEKNGIPVTRDYEYRRVLFRIGGEAFAIEATKSRRSIKYTFINGGHEEFATSNLASLKNYIVNRFRGFFKRKIDDVDVEKRNRIVTVHMTPFLYKRLKALVDAGVFPNMSEVIRTALWEFLSRYGYLIDGNSE